MQDEQILRVENKLQLLLKEFHHSQKEVHRLQKENAQLQEKLEAALQRSNDLSQTLDVVKIKSFTENDTSKKELEKRLNTYLKEIDKCLQMLQS